MRRHWLRLSLRALDLYFHHQDHSSALIQEGYNEAASSYDTHWTSPMARFSEEMLQKMALKRSGDYVDLTCGTGYLTWRMQELTGGTVTGVDASEGMIRVARGQYGGRCSFVHDDAYRFLARQPDGSYDGITCAWGLGYVDPHIFKEFPRVLRRQGTVCIIDNTLLSNWEVVWCFLKAVAEDAHALQSYLVPHFFLSKETLAFRLRLHGLRIVDAWAGRATVSFHDADSAMAYLVKTGVTAGILDLVDVQKRDAVVRRMGNLLSCRAHEGITLTHRYIAAIGARKA